MSKSRDSSWSGAARRIKKTLSAQVLSLVSLSIAQLAQAPLLLRFWSTSTYSLWLTIFTFPTLLWTLEVGVGTILSDDIARAYGREDGKELLYLEALGRRVYLCLAAWSIGSTIMLAGIAEGVHLKYFYDFGPSRWWAVVAIVLYLAVGFYTSLWCALLRALHANHISSYLKTLVRVCELIAPGIAVLCGGSIIFAAFTMFALAVVVALAARLFYRRIRTKHAMGEPVVLRSSILPLLKRSFGLQASQFSSVLFLQGTFVVLRSFVSADAAVLVAVGRTLATTVVMPANMFLWAVYPELCSFYAKNGISAWMTARRKISLVIYVYVGLIFALLSLVASPLIYHWTAKKLPIDPVVSLCIAAFAAAGIVAQLWISLLNVVERYSSWSFKCLVLNLVAFAAFTGIVLVYPLANAWPLLCLIQIAYAGVLKYEMSAFSAGTVPPESGPARTGSSERAAT